MCEEIGVGDRVGHIEVLESHRSREVYASDLFSMECSDTSAARHSAKYGEYRGK